jgi:septal ring factor EnvC (AmiA/AmiB activator)
MRQRIVFSLLLVAFTPLAPSEPTLSDAQTLFASRVSAVQGTLEQQQTEQERKRDQFDNLLRKEKNQFLGSGSLQEQLWMTYVCGILEQHPFRATKFPA